MIELEVAETRIYINLSIQIPNVNLTKAYWQKSRPTHQKKNNQKAKFELRP